jgi:hypothetical protein
MSVINVLIGDFFGNSILMGFSIIMLMIVLMLFAKANRFVISGLALIVTYGFVGGGYIPAWILFIVIAIIGIDLAVNFKNMFAS